MNVILGIDLGFRQTKSVCGYSKYRYPSLIGNPSAFELEQFTKSTEILDQLVVEFNDTTYYIGNKALETGNARLCTRTDKTNSDNDKISYLATLGLHYYNVKNTGLTVVTGLPVEDLKEEGLKEKVIENMKGTHQFLFGLDRTSVKMNVVRVLVIPQSAGAYFDYILDDNGKPIKKNLAAVKGKIIVIDVGYKTTDIITMLNGRFVSEMSCTIEKGMKDIHKELARLIKSIYGRKFDLSEMDDVCRNRCFNNKGVTIDVSNLILKAERPIAEAIINEANAILGDTRSADKVLACGGSMNLLKDYFEPFYKGYFEVLPNCEFSNASGYYKFGLLNESKSET